MFDAKRLLGQFIASQVGGRAAGGGASGGLGGVLNSLAGSGSGQRHAFGSGHGGGSPLESIVRGVGANPALAGGLATLFLGSKKGRKFGGSALKLGGMALVGSLAFNAFRNWQNGQAQSGTQAASQAGASESPGGGSFIPRHGAHQGFLPPGTGPAPSPWSAEAAPAGSAFAPAAEADQQHLGRTLLRAMIAAAKADGHIDATEQAAIFGEMDKLALDPDDKAFLLDELRAPLDIDAIARAARNQEEATEIYAASLLAIDVDNPAERAYLTALAARLDLPGDLVDHLHRTIEDAERAAA